MIARKNLGQKGVSFTGFLLEGHFLWAVIEAAIMVIDNQKPHML
jgi:hypothetical protein